MCIQKILDWFKPKPPVPPVPPTPTIPPDPPEPPVPPVPPTPPDPPTPPSPEKVCDVYVGVYDLMGATGDWKAFLRKVKDAGAVGVRFFACYSWNGPQPTSPYKQVGTWTHDNGKTFPLYRLSEWNQEFWDKLADILENMKLLGLIPWIVAEDFCSLKGDSRDKYNNPMYSSEEALGPTTPGGVWGDSLKPWHYQLFDKLTTMMATIKGNGILWDGLGWGRIEWMNEYDIVDGTDEQYRLWDYWACLSRGGYPAIVFTGARTDRVIINAQVSYLSPHGIGTVAGIVPGNHQNEIEVVLGPDRTIWSSDGYWGGTGLPDAKGRRGVGLDVAGQIGRRVKEIGGAGFELLPREVYGQNNDRADLDRLDPAVVRAMVYGLD